MFLVRLTHRAAGRTIHYLPGERGGQLKCPGDREASLSQCKPPNRESEEEAATPFMIQRRKSQSVTAAILRKENEALPFKGRSGKEFVDIY